jgi:cytochrome c oxidase assembly protein subunit 11
MAQANQSTAQAVTKLCAIVVGMFVFAVWVLPPLYDVFCEITGLNGKTGGRYQAVEIAIDTEREINVQFIATNNESMPWSFGPEMSSIKVHPGQEVEIKYLATNPTDRPMMAQAVPSVVPFKAAAYFHKTECFCFNQQLLNAGESAELPLRFIVDQDIPKHVRTITLSYTIFDISENLALN